MRGDVKRGDLHSANVERLWKNILDGAAAKFKSGEISKVQYKEVGKILEGALLADFRPLLYIIPYQGVAKLVEEVPIEERAHPLSLELRIPALPRKLFDVIEVDYE